MRWLRYMLRPRQLFKVFVGCIIFCLLIIIYTYISMDHALETLSILLHRTLTDEKLQQLMQFKTTSGVSGARAEIYCVSLRFRPMSAVTNLGLTWKIPTLFKSVIPYSAE